MYHLCSSLNLATSYSLPTLFLFSAYSLPVPKSVTFLQMGTVSEEPLFRGSQISFLKQVFMPQTAPHAKMGIPSIKVISAGHKYLLSSRFSFPKPLVTPKWIPPPSKSSSLVTKPIQFCGWRQRFSRKSWWNLRLSKSQP